MTKDERNQEYQNFNNKRFDFIAIVQFSLIPELEYRTKDLQFATRTSYCIPSDMTATKAANEFIRYIDHYSIDEDSTPYWMCPSWVDEIAPN